ncbi:MAG: c-type cytochrome [Nitratireductor sp.]|nr:c-type cytochrome [Nitratireductor sp.]
MKRLAAALVIMAIAAAVIFWVLTMPQRLDATVTANADAGDAARGERMFNAGGCASCHAAKGAKGDDRLKLGGGLALETPFGTFHAPNISPDRQTGIGAWSGADFMNAMLRGVSPEGEHFYPAFPYTSYARMQPEDIADLWAYMKTLPVVEQANLDHQLPLPFRMRRGLGLWKMLFLSDQPVVAIASGDDQLVLGRYLVEGPGHCGECHTPRNLIGGPDTSRWLSGGPAPEGNGKIPNLTAGAGGIGSWSVKDIAYYLESGFTPEFDAVGGTMVEVQENMARLPASDRDAIAAYVKALPALDSQ